MEQKELKECSFRPDISLTARPRKKSNEALGDLLYNNAKKQLAYKENVKIAVTLLLYI